ncbi:MAG: hypothetical protein D6747_00755 [Chlorobiota bacterium]|nr:MAG: hypothetical protein D6747_00755 [Chlorobiota bacterium]
MLLRHTYRTLYFCRAVRWEELARVIQPRLTALHETKARTAVVGRRPADCKCSFLQHMWRHDRLETLRFSMHSAAKKQSCSAG